MREAPPNQIDDGAPIIRPTWEQSTRTQDYSKGFQKGKLVRSRRNTKPTPIVEPIDVGGCDASPKCLTCKAEFCPEIDTATKVRALRERTLAAKQIVEAEPDELEELQQKRIIVQQFATQHSVDAYPDSDNYHKCWSCGASISKYSNRCPRCKEYL